MRLTAKSQLKRLTCAALAVSAAMVVGFGYMLVFEDEMDPNAAANVGKGLFAPTWLRFVEFLIVVSLTWPAVAAIFYNRFGTPYEIAVLKAARAKLYHLHLVSGAMLCTGVILCLANVRMLTLRDVIVGIVGVIALWNWVVERNRARASLELTPDRVG